MKRALSSFRYTIGCIIAAAVCWGSAQFAGTVCTEKSRQIPELGYQCIATLPATFGVILLLTGTAFFVGFLLSFVVELLRLVRKNK
jgi:hypothetical protein